MQFYRKTIVPTFNTNHNVKSKEKQRIKCQTKIWSPFSQLQFGFLCAENLGNIFTKTKCCFVVFFFFLSW